MIEWGLTPTDFGLIDSDIVHKIIEYRQARDQGRKNAS